MMDHKFDCPLCGQDLEAPTDLLGEVIECPACKRQIRIPKPRQPDSPHDGDAASSLTPTTRRPVARVEENVQVSQCPKCKSTDFKKVSLVWETGTSTGKSSGAGVGIGMRGDIGLGALGGVTTQQTVLAKRLSPPVPHQGAGCMSGILWVGLVCFCIWCLRSAFTCDPLDRGVFLYSLVIFSSLLAWFAWSCWRIATEEARKYTDAKQKWDQSWFCMRCGHVWDTALATRDRDSRSRSPKCATGRPKHIWALIAGFTITVSLILIWVSDKRVQDKHDAARTASEAEAKKSFAEMLATRKQQQLLGPGPKTTEVFPTDSVQLSRVPYEVVQRWQIPGGGEGRLIVVSPSMVTEKDLERLMRQLKDETKGDRTAVIQVFKSREAAAMRDNLDSLTEAQTAFFDKSFVGILNKFDGKVVMDIMPRGMNGDTKRLNP